MSARVRQQKGPDETRYVAFECPGCKLFHSLPVTGPKAWGFNGNVAKPTLTPSILARGKDWDWDDEKSQAINVRDTVCHSFVRDGRVEFLSDCTHALAGQTVDLPEVEQ